jgi:hypothetical protein
VQPPVQQQPLGNFGVVPTLGPLPMAPDQVQQPPASATQDLAGPTQLAGPKPAPQPGQWDALINESFDLGHHPAVQGVSDTGVPRIELEFRRLAPVETAKKPWAFALTSVEHPSATKDLFAGTTRLPRRTRQQPPIVGAAERVEEQSDAWRFELDRIGSVGARTTDAQQELDAAAPPDRLTAWKHWQEAMRQRTQARDTRQRARRPADEHRTAGSELVFDEGELAVNQRVTRTEQLVAASERQLRVLGLDPTLLGAQHKQFTRDWANTRFGTVTAGFRQEETPPALGAVPVITNAVADAVPPTVVVATPVRTKAEPTAVAAKAGERTPAGPTAAVLKGGEPVAAEPTTASVKDGERTAAAPTAAALKEAASDTVMPAPTLLAMPPLLGEATSSAAEPDRQLRGATAPDEGTAAKLAPTVDERRLDIEQPPAAVPGPPVQAVLPMGEAEQAPSGVAAHAYPPLASSTGTPSATLATDGTVRPGIVSQQPVAGPKMSLPRVLERQDTARPEPTTVELTPPPSAIASAAALRTTLNAPAALDVQSPHRFDQAPAAQQEYTDAQLAYDEALETFAEARIAYAQGLGSSAPGDGSAVIAAWQGVLDADAPVAAAELRWSAVTGGEPLPVVREVEEASAALPGAARRAFRRFADLFRRTGVVTSVEPMLLTVPTAGSVGASGAAQMMVPSAGDLVVAELLRDTDPLRSDGEFRLERQRIERELEADARGRRLPQEMQRILNQRLAVLAEDQALLAAMRPRGVWQALRPPQIAAMVMAERRGRQVSSSCVAGSGAGLPRIPLTISTSMA